MSTFDEAKFRREISLWLSAMGLLFAGLLMAAGYRFGGFGLPRPTRISEVADAPEVQGADNDTPSSTFKWNKTRQPMASRSATPNPQQPDVGDTATRQSDTAPFVSEQTIVPDRFNAQQFQTDLSAQPLAQQAASPANLKSGADDEDATDPEDAEDATERSAGHSIVDASTTPPRQGPPTRAAADKSQFPLNGASSDNKHVNWTTPLEESTQRSESTNAGTAVEPPAARPFSLSQTETRDPATNELDQQAEPVVSNAVGTERAASKPDGTELDGSELDGTEPDGSEPVSTGPVGTGQELSSVVADSDSTYWTIAEGVYGDGRLFRALHHVNRSALGDAIRLEAGALVHTPPISDLLRLCPELVPDDLTREPPEGNGTGSGQ